MDNSATWLNANLMHRVDGEGVEISFCVETTDKQLIEFVLGGEETAFEQIFYRYKLLVAAVASRYFHRPEQIEEMIQIVFVKVYFELENFRFQRNFSFAGWLGRVTANACLDALRSQKRKPENLICELSADEIESFLTETPAEDKTPEMLLIERDLAEKLLSRVATEDRAILQMLYEEEMSAGEVAKVTGWSISKIKVRAFRARKALRKFLRKFV